MYTRKQPKIKAWSFVKNDLRTFMWTKQVGTAMRLTESEAVFMSTLQSISTSLGNETAGQKTPFTNHWAGCVIRPWQVIK